MTLFGSTLVQTAIIWYVTLNTGEGAGSPLLQLHPIGVWADRYSKKAFLIGADIGIAVIALAMFLCLPYLTSEPFVLSLLLFMSALRSVSAGVVLIGIAVVLGFNEVFQEQAYPS